MQFGAIVGEVEVVLAGSSENGGSVRTPQCCKMVLGGDPCRHQIFVLQMHIVKQVQYEAIWYLRSSSRNFTGLRRFRGRSRRARLLYGKLLDHLGLAVVEKLKVFFVQSADRLAVSIPDHAAHQHQPDIHLERSRRIVRIHFRGNFIRGRRGVRSRWRSLRRCRRLLGHRCRTASRLAQCHTKTYQASHGDLARNESNTESRIGTAGHC
jgi:hypothetical protein